MDISFKRRITNFYYNILHSLTFIPFTILIAYAAIALFLIKLHGTELGIESAKIFPWIRIKSPSHAIEVTNTLLTGMISLTVFSFSVVMIILSQAAQNFIPKVLYRLQEDRLMQFVLGNYIGTITYYIILLVNFGKEGGEAYVPNLAFIIGVLLSIINIFLFVYFMHKTTLSIHAKKVTERIFIDTRKKLLQEKRKYKEDEKVRILNDKTEWINFYSNSTGYLQSIEDKLVGYLANKDLILKIYPVFGEYIVEKMLLFGLNKQVDNDFVRAIESGIIFYSEERVEENSKYGIRQITEIAVKALSPGINNPGTAIFCIEYLTELFCIAIKQNNGTFKRDRKNNVRIIGNDESFNNILFSSISPIRTYGKGDIKIMENLVKFLSKISLHDDDCEHQNYLNTLLISIFNSVIENIRDRADLKHFKEEVTIVCKQNEYFKEALKTGAFQSL